MAGTQIIDTGQLSVIPLRFTKKEQVYKSFMPFLKNGGLFIPTRKSYDMGQEVFLIVKLPDNPEKFQAKGIVSWLTPDGAVGHNKPGIGVEFSESSGIALKHQIDLLISDQNESDAQTYTL